MWIKPAYCATPETSCDDCNFYWRQHMICSLMPDSAVSDAILKEKKKVVK
jgi:hypothetical protein